MSLTENEKLYYKGQLTTIMSMLADYEKTISEHEKRIEDIENELEEINPSVE